MQRLTVHIEVWLLALVIVMLHCSTTLGHHGPTHNAMSKQAAFSSASLKVFLGECYGSANEPYDKAPLLKYQEAEFGAQGLSPVDWIATGGVKEDDPVSRSLNHFYSPLDDKGLTDGLSGVASFTWASVVDPEKNNEQWQRARDYQYSGLTSPSSSIRDASMGHMLFALGRVIHLNQDLTSPPHVRNDAHPLKSFFEPYGARHALENDRPAWFQPRPRGWLWWSDAGFRKLKDFWDRDRYAGQATALNADAGGQPGNRLGLAEFCNGNFISEDSVYFECLEKGNTKHFFPFPSRDKSTTYLQVKQDILAGVANSFRRDGQQIECVFLCKIADGIPVVNHSVLGYLNVMAMDSAQSVTMASKISDPNIFDPEVADEYHSILIPKAIEYSAGILDYFFRGKLEVSAAWDPAIGKQRLHITNRSRAIRVNP